MKRMYYLEVGVLLKPGHNNFEDFATCFNKKYGFCNESYLNSFDFEELKRKGINYVKNGVIDTYAIITYTEVEDCDFRTLAKEIKENGFVEGTWDLNGDLLCIDNVLFSCYKNESGTICELL